MAQKHQAAHARNSTGTGVACGGGPFFLPRAKKSSDGRASPRAAWRRGDPRRFLIVEKLVLLDHSVTSSEAAGEKRHPSPLRILRKLVLLDHAVTYRRDGQSVCRVRVLPVVPRSAHAGVRTRKPRPWKDRQGALRDRIYWLGAARSSGRSGQGGPEDRGGGGSPFPQDIRLVCRGFSCKGHRWKSQEILCRGGLVFSSCGRAFPSGKKAPPFSVSLCRYSGGF